MPEQWVFYPSIVDDESASIYVDLSYAESAPLAAAADLAWLRVYFLQPRADGLSSQEEFEILCNIEDAIVDALASAKVVAHYVGRNTSGGCRDFYFYAENGQMVETVLGQAMVQFADYEFDVDHRHEPDWSAYREFLYPSPRNMQLVQNQNVLQTLEESNDQLDVPRSVLHWAYFADEPTRDRFVAEASKHGFALHHKIEPDPETSQWGAVVAREHAVDFWSIADVTLALFDIATELGGDYDGWETPIVTDTAQEKPPE